MSTPDQLAAGFRAASGELAAAADTLPSRAAAAVLDHALTRVPRRTSRLASSGRVAADAAVFGDAVADYAAPVNADTRFLDDAATAADADALELLEADLLGALARI
jgi:hypothetical protein